MLHDIQGSISAYNKKQSTIADDEDLLKQLKSREELISSYKEAHSDMVSQTHAQVETVFVLVFISFLAEYCY